MKKALLLLVFSIPVYLYSSPLTIDMFDAERFSSLLKDAINRMELYKNERLGIKRLPSYPAFKARAGEDFRTINMNITIIPEPQERESDSRVTIVDQILIRSTGTSPLQQVAFVVRSFDSIRASSPDVEITYSIVPHYYEGFSLVEIQFKNPLEPNSTARIEITTEGRPPCDRSAFLGLKTCHYSKDLTYDLSYLHPVRAYGEEAFSFDISIVVPDDYYSTASGRLVGTIENGDGTKTEMWHNDIAQFVAFGMARFDRYFTEYEGESGKSYPVYSFVLPPNSDQAKGFHPVVGKALDWYSTRFYPYQYPAISFNEISDESDAAFATPMAQFMPGYLINAGADNNESLETFAHEVAHQWWGFMLMGSMYEYPWIDEGFAEFSAIEFLTHTNELARAFMYGVYSFLYFYMIEPSKDVPICSPQVFEDDYVYLLLTYYKGAVILGQLKNIMGEEFFRVISNYCLKNLFQFTNIEKLEEAFREITQDDYSWYFNEWLYKAGYPVYVIKYDIRRESDRTYADVYINQTLSNLENPNDNELFNLPIDIAFYNSNKEEIKRVTEWISEKTFEKSYEFSEDVDSVIIDPSLKIYLKRVRSAQKGDITLDMEVDGRDVLLAAYSYGYNWYSYFEMENARFLPNADINMDGTVDNTDLNEVVDNFGKCLLSSCK